MMYPRCESSCGNRLQIARSSATWVCSNLVDPLSKQALQGCVLYDTFLWSGVCVGIFGVVENWVRKLRLDESEQTVVA